MKTPLKNCQQRNPKKRTKKTCQFLQQSNSFNHQQPIETSQCYSFQQKFMLYQTLTSLATLASLVKLRQQQKTCSNKLCKNYVQNNNQQKIQIRYENLCENCQQQYKNQSFCLHCKQVYFDNTDDGKQWIMCEVCEKWVHTSCAQFTIKQSINVTFKCIRCTKVQNQSNTRKYPIRCQTPKVDKKKSYQFLNTIGFQWQLNADEITNDKQLIKKYLNQS